MRRVGDTHPQFNLAQSVSYTQYRCYFSSRKCSLQARYCFLVTRMTPFTVGSWLMCLSATLAAVATADIPCPSCEASETIRLMQATVNTSNTSSFWAVADVPYTAAERKTLEGRLKALGTDLDFLVHLGDIKSGTSKCNQTVIDQTDALMRLSPIPVFMVIGDNEFNDCDIDPKTPLAMWRKKFAGYHQKRWRRKFAVKLMPNRSEVFSFVHKQTLFIGLNLVGGKVHDLNEWNIRHADQLAWIQPLMLAYKSTVHSVVIFGHADPGGNQASFINPFVVFLRQKFPATIPVLYLCGDAHKWANDTAYRNVPNWFRVRLAGGVTEKINKITVDPYRLGNDKSTSFQVERYLV